MHNGEYEMYFNKKIKKQTTNKTKIRKETKINEKYILHLNQISNINADAAICNFN